MTTLNNEIIEKKYPLAWKAREFNKDQWFHVGLVPGFSFFLVVELFMMLPYIEQPIAYECLAAFILALTFMIINGFTYTRKIFIYWVEDSHAKRTHFAVVGLTFLALLFLASVLLVVIKPQFWLTTIGI